MRKRLLLLALVAVLVLMITPLRSYVLWGMKWPTGTTVSFRVNANTPDVDNELNAILAAASSWSALNPAGLRLSYSGSTSKSAGYNGENTVHWTTDDGGSTLAVARVWYSGTTTLEADMTFYGNHTWCTSGCTYDIQTVALHEFGHWVGLDHDSGIMAPSYGGIRRSIDSDSKNGFFAMYGDPERFEVLIDSPLNGQRVNGQTVVSASVQKPELLSEIRLYIDGVLVKSGSASPLRHSWNTLTASEGSHQIKAEALGSGVEPSTRQISVTVDNIHSLNISVVPSGGGSVQVNPSKSEYEHGEGLSLLGEGQGDFLFLRWEGDLSGSANPNTFSISRDMSVTARFNKPPRLRITAPEPGSSVWGQFPVSAEASDEDGMDRLQFFIDGRLVHSDQSAPYGTALNSNAFSVGLHTLTVRASDRMGMSSSQSISFSVSQIELIVSAERKQIRSWLMTAQYGQLDGQVINERQIPVAFFVIYRQKNQGEYTEIHRFTGADLTGDRFSYQDKYLSETDSYRYKIMAWSADGHVLGSSSEQTI